MTYQLKPKLMSLIEPAAMEKIESMIEKRVDGNYCKDCGYTSNRTSNMKEHVEKHIEGLEYPCDSCNKIMRSKLSANSHSFFLLNVCKCIEMIHFTSQKSTDNGRRYSPAAAAAAADCWYPEAAPFAAAAAAPAY